MDFWYNSIWVARGLALLAFIFVGALAYQRKRDMNAILAKNTELEHQAQIIVELQRNLKCGLSMSRFSADDKLITVVYSNEFRDIFGLQDLAVFPNAYAAWLKRVHPEDKNAVSELLSTIITAHNNEGNTYKCNYRFLNGAGVYRWVKSVGRLLPQTDGTRLFIASNIDISDEYNSDKLIGGNNREGFIGVVNDFLRKENSHEGYAVLYFNIRNFKAINELCGFEEGDNFLKYYKEKLAESTLRPIALGRKEDHFFCFVKWQEYMFNALNEILNATFSYLLTFQSCIYFCK